MTQVFFLLSFPYNNATLEKSLRAELHKHNFSLVYCQNILPFIQNTRTFDPQGPFDPRESSAQEEACTTSCAKASAKDWIPALHKHAQCRSFLLWDREALTDHKTLPSPLVPYAKTPATATLQQLRAWTQVDRQGTQGTSLEKICARYNGELFAAAVTTQFPGTSRVQEEFRTLLSPQEVRRLLHASSTDMHPHLSLEHSLCRLTACLDEISGGLPRVLDRRA